MQIHSSIGIASTHADTHKLKELKSNVTYDDGVNVHGEHQVISRGEASTDFSSPLWPQLGHTPNIKSNEGGMEDLDFISP
jgi:hypothetical protein